MSAKIDIDLMQHADGELELDLRDADARTKVEAVREVGQLVRGHLELAADDIHDAKFAAMWRRIDEQTTAAPRSLWARVARWFDRYRGHVITGAVSAGAVAALALILRPAGDGGTLVNNSGAIDVRPAALRAVPEIESLDTPNGSSTVINVEDEDGHATMIWVTPEDTVEGI
jgi:hypothetical protein